MFAEVFFMENTGICEGMPRGKNGCRKNKTVGVHFAMSRVF
jgi:hypothetical protein